VSEPIPDHLFRRAVLPLFALLLASAVVCAAPPAPMSPALPTKEGSAAPAAPAAAKAKPEGKATPKPESKPADATAPTPPAAEAKPAPAEPPPAEEPDADDEAAAENAEAETAAVAKPVSADPIQIYGWREDILIQGVQEKLKAKLDTGALTSSIHAEEKELFERDGKKWVRFIVTDPSMKKPVRTRIEAPLVRIAKIKEPAGESEPREVVRLSFQIGERKMRGEFTLNNRKNMLSPVLIGRNMIKELGWVDPARIHLADQKIFR
jgi:hypothetical protein